MQASPIICQHMRLLSQNFGDWLAKPSAKNLYDLSETLLVLVEIRDRRDTPIGSITVKKRLRQELRSGRRYGPL